MDSLFDGRVLLYQHSRGYRFSVDAPLLTWFSWPTKRISSCADLGAGCGVIGLSLLVADVVDAVIAVEVQAGLAALARRNANANGIGSAFRLIEGDLTAATTSLREKSFELVISNPPFWPVDTGRLPPEEERRIARHEVLTNLPAVVAVATRRLHPRKGRFCIAYPTKRLDDLLRTLADHGLNAARLMCIHPRNNAPAELILLEARPGHAGQLLVDAPLFLKDERGADTEMAHKIMTGQFSDAFRNKQDLRSKTKVS